MVKLMATFTLREDFAKGAPYHPTYLSSAQKFLKPYSTEEKRQESLKV